MNSTIRTNINLRFFKALEAAIQRKMIGGITPFCDEHNIDRRNLLKVQDNISNQRVRIEWIYYLATDFNVSVDWIFTGEGNIFRSL